ncbi:MAG TPA: hypothetical protein P5133_02865 [Spirochaetia bacterium]|nr:hypothetical protein [Spirochaetia bacterium]HRZ63843.1 hypothetical protein [Spirochaetia bacterium]
MLQHPKLSILSLVLALGSAGSAFSQAASGKGAEEGKPWLLGLARFSAEELSLEALPLADVIPRLVAAELSVLPDRLQPEAEAQEARRLAAERARYDAGKELAARLDERAARFLDPSLGPAARGAELDAADKKVAEAAGRLEPEGDAGPGKGVSPEGAEAAKPAPVKAALWEGNGRGELIEEASSAPAAAAKAQGLDLLVYGSVSPASGRDAGYVLVRVQGYDAALDRSVFSWKGFCSTEDPGPLAKAIAAKLERWTAGRDFGRLDLSLQPGSAIALADGERLEASALTVYRFEPATVRIQASAPGYAAAEAAVELGLGERRSISLSLEPVEYGSASIRVDPPEARILVDSLPAAEAGAVAVEKGLALPLSGKREIVQAYAPGREPAFLVLPETGGEAGPGGEGAFGEIELGIELKPEDGLGAGGRVAAAKDDFYKAFGWFMVSLPVSSLALGTGALYGEAAQRSLDDGLISKYYATEIAAGAAIALSAGLAANMIVRLVRYLRTAR